MELELKSMTSKFQTEKQRADNFMSRINEKELEL